MGTLSSSSYHYYDLVGSGWSENLHFISSSAECDADFQGKWGNGWKSLVLPPLTLTLILRLVIRCE